MMPRRARRPTARPGCQRVDRYHRPVPRPATTAPPRSAGARALLGLGCAVSLVLGLSGCAGNPDQPELTDALVTAGVPEGVARCAADALIDNLSDDELAQLVTRGPGGAPRDDAEEPGEPADLLRDALAACREDLPSETVPVEGGEPGGTTVTTPTTGPATTDPATTEPGSSTTRGPVFDTVPPDDDDAVGG